MSGKEVEHEAFFMKRLFFLFFTSCFLFFKPEMEEQTE